VKAIVLTALILFVSCGGGTTTGDISDDQTVFTGLCTEDFECQEQAIVSGSICRGDIGECGFTCDFDSDCESDDIKLPFAICAFDGSIGYCDYTCGRAGSIGCGSVNEALQTRYFCRNFVCRL